MTSHRRGRLFLVVGPSGGGKDALLGEARRRLAGDSRVVFAQRQITRPVSTGAGEIHVEISRSEFEHARANRRFGLSWRAHGKGYGIAQDKFDLLDNGTSLVANVSRAIVDEARRRYPPTRVIVVTASSATLRTRLQTRRRESDDEIEQRLARAASFELRGDDVVELINEGALLANVEHFVELLTQPG